MLVITVEIELPSGIKSIQAEVDSALEHTPKESGCLEYRVSIDCQNPNLLRLFEVYEDQSAFETHFATDYAQAFVKALGRENATRVDVMRYVVSERAPLPI